MGFLGKASEFFAAPGAAVGSFLGDALHNASNFACQLHYNTPGVIFDVSPFNRELWREFCKDRPVGNPPSSESTFSGGQCLGVSYRVIYQSETLNHPSVAPGTFFVERHVDIVGPVRNFTYEFRSDGVGYRAEVDGRDGHYDFPQDGGGRGWLRLRSVRVQRLDGQPDNCGDSPPPSLDPVVLPVEQRTTNINVTNVENKVINVSLTVDFPSAAVDFSLNPMLRIAIDNRKFYLNVDGWYSGEPSSSIDVPAVEKLLSDNVLQFEGTLNQYFAPINPSVDNTLVLISPSGEEKGDEQKDLPAPKWLVIDLTKFPDKAQYGVGSPTVYFAGWLEFLKEGRAMPRQQINFEKCIFRFPDGADGYAYTFTNGAEGKVSVYVEKGA